MDNKDRIIDKLKELPLFSRAENVWVGRSYIPTTLMLVEIDKVMAVIESLEREKEEVITPSPIRRANDEGLLPCPFCGNYPELKSNNFK